MTARILNETVIGGGYCIGCGVCAAIEGSPIRMVIDSTGRYQATVEQRELSSDLSLAHVCPFSDYAPSESIIAAEMYAKSCKSDSNIGYYGDLYAGHVAEGDFREAGSSGGFGTWIGHELLRRKIVDYVVSVKSVARDGEALFKYTISADSAAVRNTAKSRYYPVELSEVLAAIRKQPGRYAVVGLPCFIKAVRQLQRTDAMFASRIQFCIGLICGHQKSLAFAENLAWQCGIEPGNLKSIDFRTKLRDRRADSYGITVSDGNREVVIAMSNLAGSDWGAGAFKYKACDFCDDVFAETADFVVGDAWLPKYTCDYRGTSLLVVRNAQLRDLISDARREGRLALDDLSLQEVVRSQAGCLRHRKDAISYRLQSESQKGNWIPKKRRAPSAWNFPSYERRIQDGRVRLREYSLAAHQHAVQSNDLATFTREFGNEYIKYKSIKGNIVSRVLAALRRKIRNVP